MSNTIRYWQLLAEGDSALKPENKQRKRTKMHSQNCHLLLSQFLHQHRCFRLPPLKRCSQQLMNPQRLDTWLSGRYNLFDLDVYIGQEKSPETASDPENVPLVCILVLQFKKCITPLVFFWTDSLICQLLLEGKQPPSFSLFFVI